jgi:glycosyltransferase involved in cell wall biosynthesis
MKILFVLNEIPFPPDNGVRIVSHHAMRLMHEAGHELALAVLTEETDDLEARFLRAAVFCKSNATWWLPLPRRNRVSVQVLAALSDRLFFVERYRCAEFRQKLANFIKSFRPDVIHLDLITMIQYFDVTPSGVGAIASINDSYALTLENELADAKYSGLELIYRRVQYKKVRQYEAAMYPKFNAVHVMSEVDAAYLKALNPITNTVVIPIGVDSSLFEIWEETRKQIDVIFVAKLVGDNLESLRKFLELSWPMVQSEYPGVKLHIVGKMGPEAHRLKAQTEGCRHIVFRGHVEKLVDAYRNCGIAIVPINKNCGIITKAIEAMAAGLAVVGFEKTFAGIKEACPGRDCVATNNYLDFGRAVVELIRDERRRQAMQIAAHDLAKKYYSWSTRLHAYENMYRSSAVRAASQSA